MRAAWQRLACLAALSYLASTGASLAQDRTFTESTDVTAVEIPVQVLLDGQPVRGLTAGDFVVFQGKERQPVTGFDSVDLYAPGPAEGTAAQPVPAAARRRFLLLFDLTFSEPKAIVQARDAARDLLDALHPSDLVAVATYAASRGPELVLGFTTDRTQIAAAIDTLGVPELIDRNGDPLKIMVESVRQEVAPSATAAQGGGGPVAEGRAAIKQILLDRLEGFLRDSERADLEIQKDKVTALAHSLTDLAKLMRGVEGRKYVVYLSEGYDSSLLLGTDDPRAKAEMQKNADSGELWKVNSEQRFGSSEAVGDVEAMLEELRRADCVVQSVDIGGLRAAGGEGYVRQGGRESLFQLAHDTGGDLYESFNDLSAAMGRMLERTGVTYVLTIQPETAPDGAWHPLRVELRKGLKGARVVHRPGYYAPRPFAQRTRLEKMLATSGQVLTGAEGGMVQTSVLIAPLPGATDGTADVPVLIEVDGPSLLHLHEGPDLPAEIYVYVLDGQGRVRDFLAQTLSLDLAKVELALLQGGLKFYGHLELPPGSYRARVLVRNGRTGLYGLQVVPLEVPDPAGTAPVLLPPFFPEPKTQWLVVREAPRPGRRDVPPPFRLGDRAFLPAAKPVLAGGREARFAMLGYNLAGELQVRSQVLTSDGREMEGGDLALVGRQDDAGTARLELSFRPAALKPGEYLLRVTITDAAGRAGTASAPFVVAAARS